MVIHLLVAVYTEVVQISVLRVILVQIFLHENGDVVHPLKLRAGALHFHVFLVREFCGLLRLYAIQIRKIYPVLVHVDLDRLWRAEIFRTLLGLLVCAKENRVYVVGVLKNDFEQQLVIRITLKHFRLLRRQQYIFHPLKVVLCARV